MIRGVPVSFPRRPYGQQLALMDCVLRACVTGQNALLEAPTGTGKSLALLCAALAWQKREKEERAREREPAKQAGQGEEKAREREKQVSVEGEPSDNDSDDDFKRVLKRGRATPRSAAPSPSPIPPVVVPQADQKEKKLPRLSRVYIASRTHSQLSQLVRELKKTSYRPNMVLLGSRDQYCVNPKVASLSGGDKKNAACKRLLAERTGCYLKNGKSRLYSHPNIAFGVWDVEELVSLGQQVRACPYYAARAMVGTAEVIFCPYNYILEPSIRKSVGINLKNAVIIFDEAHNIEGIASDTASFECELNSLVSAAEELGRICDGSDKSKQLVWSVQKLAVAVREFAELKTQAKGGEELVWGGREILALLDRAKISTVTFKGLFDTFSDLIAAAEEKKEEANEVGLVQDHRQLKTLSSGAETLLSSLFSTIEFMLCAEMRYLPDYRAVISRAEERGVGANYATKTLVTRLHFWCLSSAAAFHCIKEEAKCVILASGTLSPMDSFASELGMQFSIRLETNHVIDTTRQLWAGVIPFDASGNLTFNWSFKNTENVRLQDALGAAVSDVCRVTPGGVLVFFSSYSVLNKVVLRWQSTGFLDAHLAPQKCVLVEPNGPIDSVIAAYYAANGGVEEKKKSKSTGNGKYAKANPMVNTGKIIAGQTGGLLLAVCRGKVSEGIDFSDAHCRAVVIVGLPFPNTKDLQLRLKKEDHEIKARTMPGYLNGNAWYSLQAFRALNQAIGRCIRHTNDHGAIILLDERFAEKRTVEKISKWIRPVITNHARFSEAMDSLFAFFTRNDVVPVAEVVVPIKSEPKEERYCCDRCGRDIAQTAAPISSFDSNKHFFVELARSFDAADNVSNNSSKVFVFDLASLKMETLSRGEQAVYCAPDGIAYLELLCACQTRIGAIVEAANIDNVKFIGQCWISGSALVKQ